MPKQAQSAARPRGRRKAISARNIALIYGAAPLFRAFTSATEDGYFDSGGVKIHYTVMGREGEPIVLIHGLSASVMINWRIPGIMGSLAQNYKVIGLDVRGHGKSAKPHDPEQYGVEMVDDVVRLLDHMNIAKAHIIGYSMGGMITMKLLTRHPDRFLSATVGGAGWVFEGGRIMPTLEEIAQSLETGKGFAPLFRELTLPDQPELNKIELWVINAILSMVNDVKALAAVVRGMMKLTVTEEELRANQVPTLVMIGEFDAIKEIVDPLEGVMSHAEIVVIPRTDHITAFGHPKFRKNLRRFLAAQSAAVPA